MNIDYEIIDSSKGEKFFYSDNLPCINLCSYFKRKDDIKIMEVDKQYFNSLQELNLCNYASLCYKLNIVYSSIESHDLMKKIVDMIKLCNPSIKLVQRNVVNLMEEDCLPIENLVKKEDKLYINKIFRDQCNFIGFTDSQISNLCNRYNNILEIIPPDLTERIPLKSDLSIINYAYLKELIVA